MTDRIKPEALAPLDDLAPARLKPDALTSLDDLATDAYPTLAPPLPDASFCPFGEGEAHGAGCILMAGHEPANRHIVTPGDTDDEEEW